MVQKMSIFRPPKKIKFRSFAIFIFLLIAVAITKETFAPTIPKEGNEEVPNVYRNTGHEVHKVYKGGVEKVPQKYTLRDGDVLSMYRGTLDLPPRTSDASGSKAVPGSRAVPTGTLDVPGSRTVPGALNVPGTLDVPGSRAVPGTLDVPGSRAVPGALNVPEALNVPGTLDVPRSRAVPGALNVPETLDVPGSRAVPTGTLNARETLNAPGSRAVPENLNVPRSTAVPKSSESAPSRPKLIVFYTRYFSSEWRPGIRGDLTHLGCPETRCLFSADEGLAEEADALVFHADDFFPSHVPRARRPHQRYVWMTREGPMRGGGRYGGVHFFNWTYTYHRDSDLRLPYGALVPIQAGDTLHSTPYVRPPLLDKDGAPFEQYLQDLKNESLLEDLQRADSSFLNRPQLAAWMTSHCRSWSGRAEYVKELQKHIPVDVYGKCGTRRCPGKDGGAECYSKVLVPKYKFYLALENQLCQDYVTEKTWHPLLYGIVPVVLGGANYTDFLPPNSYIDANKLAPKELADLLKSVASSPREYAKFFVWRRHWRVQTLWGHCELCHKLHHDDTASTVKDLGHWWKAVNQCTKPRVT